MNDITTPAYMDDINALSTLYCVQENDTANFRAFIKATYLMESGFDSDIVMEGVGDMFQSIITGIKKFIEKVKEFFKKILAYINSASADLDKVASELKPRLDKMDTINFKIDGYQFTVMEKPAPNMSEFESIISDYNDDMKDLTKISKGELQKSMNAWFSESNLNKLRGEVLGSHSGINEEDFQTEIRKFYRHDEEVISAIEVDKAYVSNIISHAKKLEDLKKASIKDRDKLLTLLTKTQNFFERTLYPYYKNNQLTVNTATISTDDTRFSKEDNYQSTSESGRALITFYASFKARQVNKIGAMINSVAAERANALKDQVKQERTILRKCLFGNTVSSSDKVEESTGMDYEMGYNGVDYTYIAEESNLLEHKMYDKMEYTILAEEVQFMLNSMETGMVDYLMEADVNTLHGKVKAGIVAAIDAIIATFRTKAVDIRKKYEPWIKEIQGELPEQAKNSEIKMYPFWDANYAQMATGMSRAIKDGYGSKDYTYTGFAKEYLPNAKSIADINDSDIAKPLKNYFRTGKSVDTIEPVELKGGALSSKITEICNYLLKYDTEVTNRLEAMKTALDGAQKSFSVTESMITATTHLSLLECMICESDIQRCLDYNQVFGAPTMEAYNDSNGVKPAIGGNPIGGETRKATNAAASDHDTEQAVTSVKDANDEAKKGTEGTGIKENKSNADAVSYKKTLDRFFKVAFNAYLTAREEQFIAYTNALVTIHGKGPKFDKNGNYISEKEAATKKEEKEETK